MFKEKKELEECYFTPNIEKRLLNQSSIEIESIKY